jgi:hypothetical protein
MNNEYIIVNKTAIQKRIEELEKIDEKEIWEHMEFDTLKQILSQSTPLIPEMEKVYDKGSRNHHSQYTEKYDTLKQLYISNLKLDT